MSSSCCFSLLLGLLCCGSAVGLVRGWLLVMGCSVLSLPLSCSVLFCCFLVRALSVVSSSVVFACGICVRFLSVPSSSTAFSMAAVHSWVLPFFHSLNSRKAGPLRQFLWCIQALSGAHVLICFMTKRALSHHLSQILLSTPEEEATSPRPPPHDSLRRSALAPLLDPL